MIRVTIWNEFYHEKTEEDVKALYPNGLHATIKEQLEKIFFSSDYNMLGDVMKESFKLVTSEHLDGLLNKIECPTMAIYGSDDDQTPIYMGRRLQSRMQNCKLFVMEGCNHFCYLQKPTLFNSIVKEFLL